MHSDLYEACVARVTLKVIELVAQGDTYYVYSREPDLWIVDDVVAAGDGPPEKDGFVAGFWMEFPEKLFKDELASARLVFTRAAVGSRIQGAISGELCFWSKPALEELYQSFWDEEQDSPKKQLMPETLKALQEVLTKPLSDEDVMHLSTEFAGEKQFAIDFKVLGPGDIPRRAEASSE